MSTRVVVAGMGGFGRGVASWVATSPTYMLQGAVSEIVFIDDSIPSPQMAKRYVGSIAGYAFKPDDRVLCAIGAPSLRRKVVAALTARGVVFGTFVDDRAVVAMDAVIREGSIVCPGAVVDTGSMLGKHAHVNTNCSIGHDAQLGEFTTMSPNVNIMGEVVVEADVFVGGSAAVLPRIKIGRGALVGAGSVVVRDVPGNSTVYGNPARVAANRRSSEKRGPGNGL